MSVDKLLLDLNSRCHHCNKKYENCEPPSNRDCTFLECPRGHKTLYLYSIAEKDVLENLVSDFTHWIKHYEERQPWLRKIFQNRRKIFIKILHRDQQNLFSYVPNMPELIQKTFSIYDQNQQKLLEEKRKSR